MFDEGHCYRSETKGIVLTAMHGIRYLFMNIDFLFTSFLRISQCVYYSDVNIQHEHSLHGVTKVEKLHLSHSD